MGAGELFSELLGPRSIGRNLIIVGVVAAIVIAITFFLISIGYGIIAAFLGMFVALILTIYFAWKQFTKNKAVDAMNAGWLNLFKATKTFNFPFAVRFFMAKNEASTLTGFLGWAVGRTMAPTDSELLTYMMPEAKKQKFKKKGIKLDDLIWVFRIKPRSPELPKNILCIVADSQISDLSRDASGDIQIGTDILVRGHLIPFGKFFVLLNEDYSVTKGATVAQTAAMMVVFSNFINRFSQLTAVEAKTKVGIIEQRILRKKEAEAIEQ